MANSKMYWDEGMWLLDNCHLDQRTILNMREHIIPGVFRSGMFEVAEIEQAVARFEQRVAIAELQTA